MKYIKTTLNAHTYKIEYETKIQKDFRTGKRLITDINIKIPVSSAYRGFSYLGGKSNKVRYA